MPFLDAVRLWSLRRLKSLVGPSLVVSASLLAPCAAGAETLRCAGGGVDVGESIAVVLQRCGAPQVTASFCAPQEILWTDRTRPAPHGYWLAPCQPVDEWIYERGTGYLPARLQFRNGRLWSLVYGQSRP
ncbi:DUF2845 domain-containing protein [Acidovorax sp. DW039]|uniref:DUF2845 domain-containing protein n=1 Tax=Acidovorax sp. DW039 TaxID=3095606 RepID=UPI003093BA8A|nr:DUF2845 domain-containing protein [Acidovorax sp. DW039]